jgi:hypothetical protein
VSCPCAATLGERPFIRVGEHFTAEVDKIEGSTITLKVHTPLDMHTSRPENVAQRYMHSSLTGQKLRTGCIDT